MPRTVFVLRDFGALWLNSNKIINSHCFPHLTSANGCSHGCARYFKTTPNNVSRWPHSKSNQNNGVFKKPNITPVNNIQIDNAHVFHSRRLWKPFLFTVGVTATSFTCAAVWQYENVRAKTRTIIEKPWTWYNDRNSTRKKGRWRQELNNLWNSLTEGQKIFAPICLFNCLVFLAWRIPSWQPAMMKYFCSNLASSTLCWPMVLSTFSHYSALHLAANMFVLHSFSSGAVHTLGKEQFLGLYMSAGVISSFTSYLYKFASKTPGLSLGASGAIMAILAYVCTQYPDTQLEIIFLPFIKFKAEMGIKALIALDTAGVLFGWKFFDHAAHLGGALFGIFWSYWGNMLVWRHREPVIRLWHDLRERKSKSD